MTLSLPSGVYGSILQGFFGGLSDDNKSTLWTKFLETQGLPPNTTPLPTAGLEGQFINFLQETASITTEGLSPNEIARRRLFATVIQELIRLMRELQNSNVVQNALTLFYTKYQAQYMDMIAAVPVYLGQDNINTWIPSTDPAKFTFGYDDISIQDISNYLASKQVATNSSSFQLQTAQLTAPGTSYVMGAQTTSGAPFLQVQAGDQINLQYNFTQVNGAPKVEIYLADFSHPTQTSAYQSVLLGSFTGTAPAANTQKGWADAYTAVIQTAFQAPMQSQGEMRTSVPDSSNGWTQLSSLSTQAPPAPFSGVAGGTITWSGTDNVFYGGTEGPSGWGNSGFNAGINIWLPGSTGTGFADTSGPLGIPIPSNFGNASQQVYQFGPVFIPWRYTTEEIPGAFNNPDDFDAQRAFLSADEQVQERGSVNQKLDGFIQNLKSYKETLQNNAEGVINNIQSTNSSIKSNIGVINSTIHQLKVILDGIFS